MPAFLYALWGSALFILSLCLSGFKKKYLLPAAFYLIFTFVTFYFSKLPLASCAPPAILLGALFPAAYTDYKEKTILNFNIYLFPFVMAATLVIYLINGENVTGHILAALLTLAICLLLCRFHGLGRGDILPLTAAAFIFSKGIFIVLLFSFLICLMIFALRKISGSQQAKWVPFMPGLFGGTYVSILLFILLPWLGQPASLILKPLLM